MPPDWTRPGHVPIRTWTVERQENKPSPDSVAVTRPANSVAG
jgi:hypothetical protein